MIRAEMQYPSVAFFANLPRMKPAEIRERLKERGQSQVARAKALGKSKDSVHRLLAGERQLEYQEAEAIKTFLDAGKTSEPQFIKIPVYGYAAAGGDDRVAMASDQILDRIEVPTGLTRGEVIAIRVAGDSMEPRLYSGELVIVGLGVAPMKNGDCIVEMKDGSALVKQYRGQKDGYALLHQYNPERELKIPLSSVKGMHAVVYRR